MGYEADEFANVLNGSFTGDKSPYRCEVIATHHWRICLADETELLDVEITKKPQRILGMMSLPVLQVRFQVGNANEQQRSAFFDRFFKYFHKGGG